MATPWGSGMSGSVIGSLDGVRRKRRPRRASSPRRTEWTLKSRPRIGLVGSSALAASGHYDACHDDHLHALIHGDEPARFAWWDERCVGSWMRLQSSPVIRWWCRRGGRQLAGPRRSHRSALDAGRPAIGPGDPDGLRADAGWVDDLRVRRAARACPRDAARYPPAFRPTTRRDRS